jgi:hypothetical protein
MMGRGGGKNFPLMTLNWKILIFFLFCSALFGSPQFELFNELARIFSEENNASAQRAVLWREGTAKVDKKLNEILPSASGKFLINFHRSSPTPLARTIATCRRCFRSRTCSSATARFPISGLSSPT